MTEIEVVDGDDDLPHGSIDGCPAPAIADVTDEDIELAYMCRGTMRERLHAEVALNTALDYCVFPDELTHTTFLPPVMRADVEDLRMIHEWDDQLKAACRRESEEGTPLFVNVDGAAPAQTVEHGRAGVEVNSHNNNDVTTASLRPKRALLKEDQRRAHDIVQTQLQNRLAGKFQNIEGD